MTQTALILDHLRSGATLTALDSLRLFGCLRLSARILALRQAGYRIGSKMVRTPSGKMVAEYRLEQDSL